jgi:transcriptional regulator with XRE-family HTH domain
MKSVRKKLGFRQKDLAPILNISTASLSDIESGKSLPRHDTIYNLSLNFNVNIYYLLHQGCVIFFLFSRFCIKVFLFFSYSFFPNGKPC